MDTRKDPRTEDIEKSHAQMLIACGNYQQVKDNPPLKKATKCSSQLDKHQSALWDHSIFKQRCHEVETPDQDVIDKAKDDCFNQFRQFMSHYTLQRK